MVVVDRLRVGGAPRPLFPPPSPYDDALATLSDVRLLARGDVSTYVTVLVTDPGPLFGRLVQEPPHGSSKDPPPPPAATALAGP